MDQFLSRNVQLQITGRLLHFGKPADSSQKYIGMSLAINILRPLMKINVVTAVSCINLSGLFCSEYSQFFVQCSTQSENIDLWTLGPPA